MTFWASFSGSPEPPPSPTATYSSPLRGLKAMPPPLWLAAALCSIVSSVVNDDGMTALRSAFARQRPMTMSPPGRVKYTYSSPFDANCGWNARPRRSALVARLDHRAHVEERARLDRAVLEHPDDPAPLDEEQPAAAVAGARDLGERIEAARLEIERDRA